MTNRVSIVAVLIATAALYLYRLDSAPVYISTDEAKLAAQAHSLATTGRDMLGRAFPLFINLVDPLNPTEYSVAWWQPTLFYTTAGVYRVAGVSELTTRLPVVALAVLNVWLIYLIVARWLNSNWAGLFAAVALALSPAHFIIGREAADYFCPTTVALLWLWSLQRLLHDRSVGRAAWCGLILGLGLYSYITSWVVMPLYLTLTLLAAWRSGVPLRALVVMTGVLAACAAPAIVTVTMNPRIFADTFLHYRVEGGSRLLLRLQLYWSYFSPSYLFFAGASSLLWSTRMAGVLLLSFAILLPTGLWALLTRYRSHFGYLVVIAFALTPLPIVIAVPEAPFYATPRAILAVPLAVIIAAAGLQAIIAVKTPVRLLIAAGLVILMPLQFAGFARDYFGDYRARSASWIDAMNFAGVARSVAALDSAARVPALLLSRDDIGEDKTVKLRFHFLAAGRMDLWARTRYLMIDDPASGVERGDLLVFAAANPRRSQFEGMGWTLASEVNNEAGDRVAVVLRKD